MIVAEERQENRWIGAPRKLCHVASHEISFGEAASVLLLALRDCHVPRAKPAKLPSPEEVSDLIASAGGPRAKFTHMEIPSGHNFA